MRNIVKMPDDLPKNSGNLETSPLWRRILDKLDKDKLVTNDLPKPRYSNYDASIVKKGAFREQELINNKATKEVPSKELHQKMQNAFNDLETMKEILGKTYKEIKEIKPPNSPNIAKWFENGGTIKIEIIDGKYIWTYTDAEGRSVQYIDGK